MHAAYGRIEPELLFDPARRERPPVEQLSFDELLRDDAGPDAHDHSGHLHAAYESVEFTSDSAAAPQAFLDFLDSRPPGLYRIKGFVDFGAADPATVTRCTPSAAFSASTVALAGAARQRPTQLVLIGSGIDGDALRKELADCVAAEDRRPRSARLWGVLRYVQSDDSSAAEPDETGDDDLTE